MLYLNLYSWSEGYLSKREIFITKSVLQLKLYVYMEGKLKTKLIWLNQSFCFFIQRKTFFAKQSPLMVLGCICILSSNPDVLNSSPPPPPPPNTLPSSQRRGPSRRPCSPTAPQARRPELDTNRKFICAPSFCGDYGPRLSNKHKL